MRIPTLFTPELQKRYYGIGRILAIAGGVLFAASAFLSWSYGGKALDDMSFMGSPSTLQWFGFVLGLVLAACAAMTLVERVLDKGNPTLQGIGRISKRFGWIRGAKAAGIGVLAYIVLVLIAIALELGGLVNVEIGGWVALAAAVIGFVGTGLMTAGRAPYLERVPRLVVLEIISIAAVLAALLFAFAFALNQDDGGAFLVVLAFIGILAAVALRSGFGGWFALAGRRNRNVLVAAAFAVAFFFPFTQNGSDANMSIATQVLISRPPRWA